MLDLTDREVAFAVQAVAEAGGLARRIQREMVVEGVAKSDLSPVTVGDYAVQAIVVRALEEAFPADVLVGEESAKDLRAPGAEALLASITGFVEASVPGTREEEVCTWIDRGTAEPAQRFWTLDPIDGTKGYLRGEQYAIALALIEDGLVQLGALCCPNLSFSPPSKGETGGCIDGSRNGAGVILVARRGQGTWAAVMDVPDSWTQLHVSAVNDPAQARILRSVEAAHTNADEIDALATELGITAEPVRMDSQAKYAVLAAGGAELLLRFLSPKRPDYKERIWDQAAGSIVLEEAGGAITDLNGLPLDFTQGRGLERNTGVFASNGHLHAHGLQAIRKATNT
jgi:3'(2'), 5'-bisphosphate nucleotidase